MKLSKVLLVFVFAAAAVLSAAAGFYLTFENMEAKPVLVQHGKVDRPAVTLLLYRLS